jgi:hypothetical protein
VSVFTSIVLLNGLRDVLQRRKLARWLTLCGLTAPELLAAYGKLIVVVWPVPLPAPASIDPLMRCWSVRLPRTLRRSSRVIAICSN